MPRWATPCGGVPAMSRPSKMIRPDVGVCCPVSRLKKVVFPAPLGPITECSEPSATSIVTALTAVSAPKDLVRRSVLTRGIGPYRFRCAARGAPRPEARPRLDHPTPEKQYHDDKGNPEQERPARPHGADRFRQPDEDERTDDRTVEGARAADEGSEDDIAGEDEADGLERHDAEEHGVEYPRQPREGSAHHEGGELHAGDVVAQSFRAQLVLANGLQDLAERRLDDALHDPEREQEQHGDGRVVGERTLDVEAEDMRTRNAGHAVLASRHRGPLIGREVEHLVQREGEHDEVETGALDAEISHGGRRDGAYHDARAQRQEHIDPVVLQQVAGHVGGRAKEGGLAEREQSRVAHEQVQAQPEDGEDPDLGGDGMPDEDREEHHRGKDGQPSLAHRMPNNPWGRTRRTPAMTAKITATEASGHTRATRLCARPTRRPATMEPSRLPSPASATTTKAMPSMSTPIHGFNPRMGAVRAPAIPARTQPRAKAAVKRRWMSMPRRATISLSSMPARMIAP